MKALGLLLAAVLLAACSSQTTGPNGRKTDLTASARDRVALATEYLRQGDNENAQIQLTRALKLDPDSAEAHSMLGVLLERDGDIKGADKEYRRALRLRADYSQVHNNYAIFLFRNGRYKEALKQFEAATEDLSYDHRAQAYEGMGRSALKTGKKEIAARAFARALKLDPSLSISTLEMSEIQYAQNNYEGARASYRRYLGLTERAPQTAQSLWLGIRIERHLGDRNALASYELALKKLYPASPEYKLYIESLKPTQ